MTIAVQKYRIVIVRIMMIDYEKLLQDLHDILKVQLGEPTSYTDPYMQGLANGLLLAKAILTKNEPNFIELKKGEK